MKRFFLLFVALCCTVTASVQARISHVSPVGTLETFQGREAIVVDLGGNIGMVAIATMNVGANSVDEYGTNFDFTTANTVNANDLRSGWYVPSPDELKALYKKMKPNADNTGMEWTVAEGKTLKMPGKYVADPEAFVGTYVSNKDAGSSIGFQFDDAHTGKNVLDISPVSDDWSEFALRPFHKLVPAFNEIWYTTSTGKIVPTYRLKNCGANLVGNYYDATSNLGFILFEGSVTSICDSMFYNRSSDSENERTPITSIRLPENVTSIGDCAFYGSSIESINLPEKLTSIGNKAFYNCTNATFTEIPSGVQSIGRYAFRGCKKLKSVTIPDGVKTIAEGTFYECQYLSSIKIPDCVTTIEDWAFYDCCRATSCNMPKSIKTIGRSSFYYVSALDSNWVLPEGLTTVGDSAFYTVKAYIPDIPSTLKNIGKHAFDWCRGLQAITIPDGIKIIPEGAFLACFAATKITIPNSVTTIEDEGIAYCTNVKNVEIPNSVTSIGYRAFRNWESLESIEIPNSIRTLPKEAFMGCKKLKSVTIPTTITEIGQSVFSYCEELESIIIPECIVSISQDAFGGCTKLKSVSIPKNVSIIQKGAFATSGLTSITIPSNVKTFGEGVFRYCKDLISVEIQEGLTSLEEDTFSDCPNLTTVKIPVSIEYIGRWAFEDCTNLKDIYVYWTDKSQICKLEPSALNGVDPSNVTLHVPFGTESLYRSSDVWKNFNIPTVSLLTIKKSDGSVDEQGTATDLNLTIDETTDDFAQVYTSTDMDNITSIAYSRNFAPVIGKWQCWFMPFEASVEVLDNQGLDVAEIAGVLLDEDNNAVLAFKRKNSGTMNANTPYVIRLRADASETSVTLNFSGANLKISEEKPFTIQSAYDNFTFKGNYESKAIENCYSLNREGDFQKMSAGVKLRPLRFGLTISERPDSPYESNVSSQTKIRMLVLDDEETTGIENMSTAGVSESNVHYDLTGRKVTHIQKGQFYIKNGKKLIVK